MSSNVDTSMITVRPHEHDVVRAGPGPENQMIACCRVRNSILQPEWRHCDEKVTGNMTCLRNRQGKHARTILPEQPRWVGRQADAVKRHVRSTDGVIHTRMSVSSSASSAEASQDEQGRRGREDGTSQVSPLCQVTRGHGVKWSGC